jgi:uncharacterized membrane protein
MGIRGEQLVALGGGPVRFRAPLLPLVVGLLVALFLLAPWPFAHKAHAILHGLCAQRPSHSLMLGGQTLPFDARMTGIYGGFAVTTLYLVARGRYRAFRFPPASVAVLLALFIAALALDGGNAFLVDIGRTPLYEPDNRLRLATGLLTGISLAVAIAYLTATTLWREGDWTRRTIEGPGEVALLVLLQVPFAFMVASGARVLFVPVSLFLVAAAAAAIGLICLSTIVLGLGRDRTFNGMSDLQVPAAMALVAAIAVMALIAGGRFWLERSLGLAALP